jgi:hypothetical protein
MFIQFTETVFIQFTETLFIRFTETLFIQFINDLYGFYAGVKVASSIFSLINVIEMKSVKYKSGDLEGHKLFSATL